MSNELSATPRVTLVTGAASGIGRHLVGFLSATGHHVLATDANEKGLAQASAAERWPTDRVIARVLDVRSAESWETAVNEAETRFGALDLLMNVAGVLSPAWIGDIEPRDLDLMIDVNVKGVVLGTRAAARRMVPRRSGHIVNFGSLASLAPVPGLSVYSASKFAVRGFSLAAASELRDQGVAVTVVMPDAVKTPMLAIQLDREEAALTFSGARALTVEDIERAIVQKVLPERPLEVAVPSGRAVMARVAGTFPALAMQTRPLLVRLGRAQQARARTEQRAEVATASPGERELEEDAST